MENPDLTVAVNDPRRGLPSASGLERLRLCPGSWLAEQKMPEVSTPDAEMGTRLHKHMEDGTLPENAEEADACAWAADMVKKLDDDLLGDGEKSITTEARWWSGDTFSGQIDRVSECGTVAHVTDYKFGRIAVDPGTKNLQLAAYAMLLFANHVDVQTVYVDIVAPFVSREVPEVAEYTRDMFPELQKRIYAILERAQREDAPLRPSEKACRYCSAATSCPAAMQALTKASAIDVKQAWTLLTPAQRAEAYKLAQMARKWADKVESAVKLDLAAEVEIPGLALTEGRKMFSVEDAAGAFGALEDILTPQEFTGCCSVKISALDELVHAKLKAGNEKQRVADSKEYVRNALGPFGKVKVSAPSIKEVKA